MKLAAQLLLPTVMATAAMLGMSQLESWFVGRQAEAQDAAQEQRVALLLALGQAEQQLGRAEAALYRRVALPEGAEQEAGQQRVQASVQAVSDRFQPLVERAAQSTHDVGLGAAFKALDEPLQRWRSAADAAAKAVADPAAGGAALKALDAPHEALHGALKQLTEAVQVHARSQSAAEQAAAARMHALLTVASLLLAAAAVGLAWWNQRRAVGDLQRAASAAGAIAHGDLTQATASTRADEIGALLRAMGEMQQGLQTMVKQVRRASDNIGTASAEIATGNQDLSQRTEQTAGNLQRTASAVEQLTGTVRASADSAAQANQMAQGAQSVALRGGEVVGQVVATMDDINAASRKIADIIGTIDGIAFQTNILALNAAVEAARAGEQGRGFAVVAGEVRALAQRSAEAAREIKALIGASVDKVESGSSLVRQAGETMTEIVASVQRVTDIIGEITAAASEQTQGFEQVNQAVLQLDQMTQQNAALVEQSAAAAESLRDQARSLAEVVDGFVTNTSSGRTNPSAGTTASFPAVGRDAPRLPPAAPKPPAAAAAAPAPAIPAAAAAPRNPGRSSAASTAATAAPVAKPVPAVTASAAATASATASDDWESF